MKTKTLIRVVMMLAVLAGSLALLLPAEAQAQSGGPVIARHSGKCLDIKGASTVPRASAQQYRCTGNSNQLWSAVASSSKGYISLVAAHSGQCLDVRSARKRDGKEVQQFTCKGSKNQQWLPVPVSKQGYVLLVARHSGKCLDVKSGSTSDQAKVQQFSCNGGKNQQWLLP